MDFPCTWTVEWPWLQNVASQGVKSNDFWRLIKDRLDEEGPIQWFEIENGAPAYDFVNFSQVIGEIGTEHPDDPAVTRVIEFGGPLMCMDLPLPLLHKDLDLGWEAYGVFSPASVAEVLHRYDRISFDAFEPFYARHVAAHPNTYNGDLPYSDFINYCDVWRRFFQSAQDAGRGAICWLG